MWIMVAGPYRGGSPDVELWASNLRRLNESALALHRAGHVPVIGVNMALPVIEAAGGERAYTEIMMPMSLALSDRCDACLRVGGASRGADEEVARFVASGRPVFWALSDVPPACVEPLRP